MVLTVNTCTGLYSLQSSHHLSSSHAIPVKQGLFDNPHSVDEETEAWGMEWLAWVSSQSIAELEFKLRFVRLHKPVLFLRP